MESRRWRESVGKSMRFDSPSGSPCGLLRSLSRSARLSTPLRPARHLAIRDFTSLRMTAFLFPPPDRQILQHVFHGFAGRMVWGLQFNLKCSNFRHTSGVFVPMRFATY